MQHSKYEIRESNNSHNSETQHCSQNHMPVQEIEIEEINLTPTRQESVPKSAHVNKIKRRHNNRSRSSTERSNIYCSELPKQDYLDK
ncbi:hypothetical protein CHS0354_007852 [Potamilus streckersoni]|uniref:Uncharacterized protein n=1 Tax=Potamilus streckersoni TaxID=2493646 RepID=A0AAE0SJD0_9BIVA|nr:hypothetical protein CHS0354_007852 [Potamilus streckersoni]